MAVMRSSEVEMAVNSLNIELSKFVD